MDCTLYPARFLHPWDSPAGILEFIAISFSDPDANGGSDSKASAYKAGVLGSIPGPGRSPGEENGNPLQYSCLENPMDGEAWWATVHGVTRVGHKLTTKWQQQPSLGWTFGKQKLYFFPLHSDALFGTVLDTMCDGLP